MKRETRVTDGATLRRSRIMQMLHFIADTEGSSTHGVQSFMFMQFGLKFRTTSEYLHETNLAGAIALGRSGEWIVTDKYKKYLR